MASCTGLSSSPRAGCPPFLGSDSSLAKVNAIAALTMPMVFRSETLAGEANGVLVDMVWAPDVWANVRPCARYMGRFPPVVPHLREDVVRGLAGDQPEDAIRWSASRSRRRRTALGVSDSCAMQAPIPTMTSPAAFMMNPAWAP